MWPGFCSWQQELHQSLLSSPDGRPIVWRMMDSSPQGGWDWLLHGARSLAPGALARAAADAHALCDPSTADEAKEAAAERLAKVVSFTRGGTECHRERARFSAQEVACTCAFATTLFA